MTSDKECKNCHDGIYLALGKKVSTRIVMWLIGILLPLLASIGVVVLVTYTGQRVNASTIKEHETERVRHAAAAKSEQDRRWMAQEKWQGEVLKKLDTIAERTWTHNHE